MSQTRPKIDFSNPASITEEQRIFLSNFLRGEITKRDTYVQASKIQGLEYDFVQDFLIRITDEGEYRIEVMDTKKFADGTFGDLHRILATLAFREDDSLVIKTHTERAVKILKDSKLSVEAEIKFGKKAAPELGYKFVNQQCMVMHYLNAKELGEIPLPKSPEMVLKIMLNALFNLQKVHDNKIFHRDVKPENILVDKVTGATYLFDFNGSCESNVELYKASGTPHYISPEHLNLQGQLRNLNGKFTEKSDGFSLGKTFAAFLRCDDLLVKACNDVESVIVQQTITYPTSFNFSNLKKMYPTIANEVEGLITKMTAFNPEKRISIPEAIEIVENLQLKLKLSSAPKEHHQSIKDGHQAGISVRNELANTKTDCMSALKAEIGLEITDKAESVAIEAFIDTVRIDVFSELKAEKIKVNDKLTRKNLFDKIDSIQSQLTFLENSLTKTKESLKNLPSVMLPFGDSEFYRYIRKLLDTQKNTAAINYEIKEINKCLSKKTKEKYGTSLDGHAALIKRLEIYQTNSEHYLIANLLVGMQDNKYPFKAKIKAAIFDYFAGIFSIEWGNNPSNRNVERLKPLLTVLNKIDIKGEDLKVEDLAFLDDERLNLPLSLIRAVKSAVNLQEIQIKEIENKEEKTPSVLSEKNSKESKNQENVKKIKSTGNLIKPSPSEINNTIFQQSKNVLVKTSIDILENDTAYQQWHDVADYFSYGDLKKLLNTTSVTYERLRESLIEAYQAKRITFNTLLELNDKAWNEKNSGKICANILKKDALLIVNQYQAKDKGFLRRYFTKQTTFISELTELLKISGDSIPQHAIELLLRMRDTRESFFRNERKIDEKTSNLKFFQSEKVKPIPSAYDPKDLTDTEEVVIKLAANCK